MKFAHDFKDSLASQGFPPHWIAQAIPYSQLKKCLKKVQQELNCLGLDPQTLRALLDSNSNSPIAIQYRLNASVKSSLVRPKLTINVHMQNGVPIDATLTPSSRQFIEKIVVDRSRRGSAQTHPHEIQDTQGTYLLNGEIQPELGSRHVELDELTRHTELSRDENIFETIEVPLVFDGEFFDMLQHDVRNLDALEAEEENILAKEITELGKEVSQTSRPTRFSKTDLDRWRQVFELYVDAEVFFATHERDHGARSSQKALKQLQWFQNEIEKHNLPTAFKFEESRVALTRFLNLNLTLLKYLQFQELNRLAVSKILKSEKINKALHTSPQPNTQLICAIEFDKRTSLEVSRTFPAIVRSEQIWTGRIAKDICAQMSQELVSLLPQINDYLCPICYSIAYLPVRLDCQHVFCIRCIVKIQKRREKNCPLCRAEVVQKASEDNLDRDLEKYMKKYFPKEVKEKQRANEIERGIEDFGPSYRHKECTIM